MTDSETTTQVDDQLKPYFWDAEKWFATLDRTLLGTFAVDSKLLILRFAYELLSQEDDPDFFYRVGYETGYLTDARNEDLVIDDDEWAAITAEMFFWWEYYDAPSEWYVRHSKRYHPYKEITAKKLHFLWSMQRFLVKVPTALPYLEAGISDRKFIKRCVDANVDPTVAKQLQRNVA